MSPVPRGLSHWGLVILGLGLICVVIGLTVTAASLFNALAPPAVTYSDDFRILNSPMRAGDTVVLLATRCAWNITGSGTISAEVSRQITSTDSAASIGLGTVHADIEPGCHTIEGRSLVLPPDIPPGHWQLRGSITARGKTTAYESEPFEVIP